MSEHCGSPEEWASSMNFRHSVALASSADVYIGGM